VCTNIFDVQLKQISLNFQPQLNAKVRLYVNVAGNEKYSDIFMYLYCICIVINFILLLVENIVTSYFQILNHFGGS